MTRTVTTPQRRHRNGAVRGDDPVAASATASVLHEASSDVTQLSSCR